MNNDKLLVSNGKTVGTWSQPICKRQIGTAVVLNLQGVANEKNFDCGG
ncbi:MAG: hypothetical protein NC428_09525 [Clostridium sp.]|nr:hypothetical protein [Clostridium sp.]